MNNLVTSTEIEAVIKKKKKKNKQTNKKKNSQKTKAQDQMASQVNFIKDLEKS